MWPLPVPTVAWVSDPAPGHLELIDQTRLPGELVVIRLRELEEARDAIRRLAVRGAPAIGCAAAFGLVLGARQLPEGDENAFMEGLQEAADRLRGARPTAVNLAWALDRLLAHVRGLRGSGVPALKAALLEEARRILEEDRETCRRMGEVGAHLVREGDGVLTHCNTGALATCGTGSALGVLYQARAEGRSFRVYADETRPLLQGARLTTWELQQAGIPVTLLCDGAAAELMARGAVQSVMVGADRIAANGDVANKIGTYSVAVLARHHGVPFHVVAPASTFDLTLPSGSGIPIEERPPEEVTEGFGMRTAPEDVDVHAPAFDVTPAALITSIITDRGVIQPVDTSTVAAVLRPGEARAATA